MGLTLRRRAADGARLPGLHPVVARVMAGRGITDPAQLDPSLEGMLAPRLAGIDAAVDRLARALGKGESILVVGDFDADGATSVTLALRALRAFGHARVDYLVPNRFEYGYGLTAELVELATAEDTPGLILTVDNGISSHEGVRAAARLGIDTIVTDHHLPGAELPPAIAVVNPNRPDCGFESKNLAGVGVVFYLLVALRARLDGQGWFEGAGAPSMAAFLDLVALGTVADVVRLDRNNRILVEQGLRRIRAGQGCAGIRALLTAAGRDPAGASAGDLGFAVGPRLNAAGRLADMALGIETLLADERDDAAARAGRLDRLNRERRDIEAEMRAQADAELERLQAALAAEEALPAGITLHDARWHQGVIGILAGRVREAIHRPTVVFADAGDGELKGSARSIPGLHVRDVLATIDARDPGLMTRFGGHAMAAGLSLPAAALERFRATFANAVEEALGGPAPAREVVTDGALAPAELGLETAEALRAAGPWGAGFPAPTFDGRFVVRAARIVGEQHLKLALAPAEGGPALDAIWFHGAPGAGVDVGATVRLVFRLEVNEFRGRRSAQLVVEHLLLPDDAS